ncbi:spectrin beta chain-like isoform X4 [Dysidea avara]|uniref:spectrin beta chain-like isoform X4 n=1 Tax=Dysidea avara TaxID=196820 RepID=UPI003326160E
MSLQSEDYDKHLLSVQDLLHKYSLLEDNIVTITDSDKLTSSLIKVIQIVYLSNKNWLRCTRLVLTSPTCHQRLQESHKVQEFSHQTEEEEVWMKEKEHKLILAKMSELSYTYNRNIKLLNTR